MTAEVGSVVRGIRTGSRKEGEAMGDSVRHERAPGPASSLLAALVGLVLFVAACSGGGGGGTSKSSRSTVSSSATAPSTSAETTGVTAPSSLAPSSAANVNVSSGCADAMKRYDDVISANGSDADERTASEATLTSCKSSAEWLRAVVPYTGPGDNEIAPDAPAAAGVLNGLCNKSASPAPACRSSG